MPRTAMRWCLVLALGTPVCAEAGVIRGVVKVRAAHEAEPALQAYPGHADAMPVGGVVHGLASDAVVWVENVPVGADSAAPRRETPRLAQVNQRFLPRVLPIAIGETVDFPNRDPIYHNVFSLSPARRFDLGKYPRGHSKQVAFPRTGFVSVFCDIHREMAAWIVVLPNRAFTQPDANGAFELPHLPPGRYVLHAWHPDATEVRKEIRLSSEPVTLEFDL